MLSIPGKPGCTCDGWSRREFMRVGGAGLFGVALGDILRLQALGSEPASDAAKTKAGWGKAKSVILIFLQGGPSHIDIWDPKPEAPSNVRGEFHPIKTKIDTQVSETMPMLAQQLDKATLIRSVSYTPNGLFNHTAAIYQMMTGYTPDRVSPSGQLEPPNRQDFPCIGAQIARIKPPDVPMLPFVMLPRPLQESNVIGKAGTAGFLGKAYDPYYAYPTGADTDQTKMDHLKIDDLAMRAEISKARMQRRAGLRKLLDEGMPELEKAVKPYALDEYYGKAFELVLSGKARTAFDLTKEPDKVRDRYGRHTFGQATLTARRLIEAGTRVVQVNWPSVANGDPLQTAWDTHASNFGPLKNLHCPRLDSAVSALLEDLDQRGMLKDTIVVAIGEFGRSPRLGVSTSGNGNAPDGRDHWPYCYTALIAGAGIKRGSVYGKSDPTASSPVENPVHPTEVLATVYHSLGISPDTITYNHLNQPRELVKAKPVIGLFG